MALAFAGLVWLHLVLLASAAEAYEIAHAQHCLDDRLLHAALPLNDQAIKDVEEAWDAYGLGQYNWKRFLSGYLL